MDQQEFMVALERLMVEFFNHTTGNERKREIEQEFQVFKSRPDAWILCSHFITHSSSHYVIMFSLSYLESVIYKLDKVHSGARNEIRQTIQNYLFTSGIHAPHHLREKYAKLLVDIAKLDWPHEYTDFIDFIGELLNNGNNVLIGLILLRITSEEFTSDSPIIDTKRREELQRLIKPHIPKFLLTLCQILESLDNKPRHTATATPPPSPTHSGIGMEAANFIAPINTYAPDNKALNREILKTLQHFFTWVPLSTINSEILKRIFNVMNISSYSQEDMDLCLLALSTVNEILYRKCCPSGCEYLLISLYHYTVDLLKDLSSSSIYQLESIDPMFVQKLAELIILLTQQHFWRIEKHANVSTLEFLSLFYNFTNQLPSAQCYYQCLTAWSAFLKVAIQQNVNGNHEKYGPVYQVVYTMMLKKLQYTTNFDQLKGFNNQDVNEDNETEWGLFVKISNEIIALIAGVAPIDTFFRVLAPWHDYVQSYIAVMNKIEKDYSLSIMNSAEDMKKLCCLLADFATLTQTLARLSSLFIDQKDEEISKATDLEIAGLFQKLIECATAANKTAFMPYYVDQKLAECMFLVHSELLAALRTWLFWMLQKNNLNKNQLNVLVEIAVWVLVKMDKPYTVLHSAACLLHSITAKVPQQLLLEVEPLMEFINRSCIFRPPVGKIRELVDESVCNTFLCNGPSPRSKQGEEQLWQVCFYQMNTYIGKLASDFALLTPSTEVEEVRIKSSELLDSLSHIIDYCGKFSNGSKMCINSCVENTVKHAMKLFPVFEKYPDVSQTILSFFISVFCTLQYHIGVDGTREILDLFLKQALQDVDMAYVGKLLQLMKLVAETNARCNQEFLPSIVGLCLHNLYPMVLRMSKENPDVYLELLQLFYSLLAHRWAYFHQSQVRAGYSPCVEGDSAVVPQRPDEFISILEVFGQALLQEDINISKFSIGALEDLNRLRNLYSKPIFREHLLVKFLNVLMEALMSKAYCSLSEDVQIAIYHMSFHNNQIFFSTFLPGFVSTLEGVNYDQRQLLLENFKNDRDMPTFINHLKIFVSKAQNLRMCNS